MVRLLSDLAPEPLCARDDAETPGPPKEVQFFDASILSIAGRGVGAAAKSSVLHPPSYCGSTPARYSSPVMAQHQHHYKYTHQQLQLQQQLQQQQQQQAQQQQQQQQQQQPKYSNVGVQVQIPTEITAASDSTSGEREVAVVLSTTYSDGHNSLVASTTDTMSNDRRTTARDQMIRAYRERLAYYTSGAYEYYKRKEKTHPRLSLLQPNSTGYITLSDDEAENFPCSTLPHEGTYETVVTSQPGSYGSYESYEAVIAEGRQPKSTPRLSTPVLGADTCPREDAELPPPPAGSYLYGHAGIPGGTPDTCRMPVSLSKQPVLQGRRRWLTLSGGSREDHHEGGGGRGRGHGGFGLDAYSAEHDNHTHGIHHNGGIPYDAQEYSISPSLVKRRMSLTKARVQLSLLDDLSVFKSASTTVDDLSRPSSLRRTLSCLTDPGTIRQIRHAVEASVVHTHVPLYSRRIRKPCRLIKDMICPISKDRSSRRAEDSSLQRPTTTKTAKTRDSARRSLLE